MPYDAAAASALPYFPTSYVLTISPLCINLLQRGTEFDIAASVRGLSILELPCQ